MVYSHASRRRKWLFDCSREHFLNLRVLGYKDKTGEVCDQSRLNRYVRRPFLLCTCKSQTGCIGGNRL